MWKRYDELTDRERANVAAMFSADASDDARRQYGYWVEADSVQCRKVMCQVKWDARTLYA